MKKKRTIRECHFLFFSGADGGHQRDAQSRDSAHFLHSSFFGQYDMSRPCATQKLPPVSEASTKFST